MTITRPLNEITFLDIYRAVECTPDEELFHFHENPNSLCPVGRNIHHVLGAERHGKGTGGDYACRCEKRYGYVDCKRRNVKERVKKECTEMPHWR